MKLNKSFFVVGTDTDIGKTYVSTLLYKSLKKYDYFYYKPIQSGCFLREDKLVAPDVDFLCKFNELEYNDAMVTYTLKEEVSPHLAAEMENTVISIDKIEDRYNEILKKYSATIVEGAGGLFVPLIRDKFYIYDLVKLFNLPVVLVCGTRVGAINHTILTIKALENMGIKIHGLIFNNYKDNFYEDDNIREILTFSQIKNYLIIKNGVKEISEEKIKDFFGGLLNE